MDQKQLSQLDPKLKSVYDRVMGVSEAPVSSPINVPVPPSNPFASQPSAMPSLSKSPPPKAQSMPTPSVAPENPPQKSDLKASDEHKTTMGQVYTTVAVEPVGPPVAPQHAESNKTFTLLFVVLGIVFFVLYTVFWIQFFRTILPTIS